MKQYTTTNLEIRLDGAAGILADCKVLSVYIKGNVAIDFSKDEVDIDNDVITVHLSQGDTGRLGPGAIYVEVTIGLDDGSTYKSNTLTTTIDEALRKDTL